MRQMPSELLRQLIWLGRIKAIQALIRPTTVTESLPPQVDTSVSQYSVSELLVLAEERGRKENTPALTKIYGKRKLTNGAKITSGKKRAPLAVKN